MDIIRMDDAAYPFITEEESCLRGCTRCIKVCPGETVEFGELDDRLFGVRPDPRSVTGVARRALVSFATDERLRYESTSGGFVTQLLLFMMDQGIIDGALVLGTVDEGDGWKERPLIARTADELRQAVKSKYMVVPHLQPLREMEEIEGTYAVVALPCYVHALRKYQKVSPKLRKRLKLVIGLYCNVVFERHLLDDACELLGVQRGDVVDFRFRHGDWPGGVVACLRDGTERKVLKLEEMKDEFNLLKLFYAAPRCNMCTDFSAEYADLAVGDPWLRGPDGNYLFEDGRTAVLVRTPEGDDLVRQAEAAGYLNVREIPLETYMVNFEYSGRYKRDYVPKNLAVHRLLGHAVPQYQRPIGLGKMSGWPAMLIKASVRWLARYKWFRRVGLTLAQTRLAISYLRWNRGRKARQFAASYERRRTFVKSLHVLPAAPTGGGNGKKRASGV